LQQPDGLTGVVELGLLTVPDAEARQQIDDLLQLLSSHLNSVQSHALRAQVVAEAGLTKKVEA
jgi:hypothetical protein